APVRGVVVQPILQAVQPAHLPPRLAHRALLLAATEIVRLLRVFEGEALELRVSSGAPLRRPRSGALGGVVRSTPLPTVVRRTCGTDSGVGEERRDARGSLIGIG